MPNETKHLNYFKKTKSNIDIDPATIPNLIPKNTLNEWQNGDQDPYYKIQEIEYPIEANGYNYQESFFQSFIKKLKSRPIPGSKAGHTLFWGERPSTDFIMVGAKLESNGDGTGKVYFKNYIPKEAATGSNDTFIKENKSDMVHYSLVSYTKDEIFVDEDGNRTRNVVESIKGERNDAVEFGLGAMDQKTNQKSLDESGQKNNQGEENMTKQELLEKLKTLKANAEITLLDIAEALDLNDQVVKPEHLEALKVFNAIKEAGIEDPIKEIKALKEQLKANAETVRGAELDKSFGVDEDGKNTLRQYAGKECKDVAVEDLEKKINELKKDPIALKLAQEKADFNSESNDLGFVETKEKKNTEANKNGRRVDKY